MLSRNNLKVGTKVYTIPFVNVEGEVTEFGSKATEIRKYNHETRRTDLIEFASVKVTWPDGSYTWVSSADCVALDGS